MRTYNTLIPFVTLALTLAANAAPTPSPSNERGYAQTAVAGGVFDVPVEARGVVDVPPAGADLSRRTEGQTPSSSFTSSIYRRHQEPTGGMHRITEYYAPLTPEKKPESGEFANQHHSGGVNPQHHQNGVTPPEGNSGNRPPHHEGNPTPPGSPFAHNEKYEGHHSPPGSPFANEKNEGHHSPPGSPLSNNEKHGTTLSEHPVDEKPPEDKPKRGGLKGQMDKARGAVAKVQNPEFQKKAKSKAVSFAKKAGLVAGGTALGIGGTLAVEAAMGSSSSGQTGTGATSTGMTEGGGVAGSANMDMTTGGATGTSDGSMGMGDGSMGTGTGTSDGSMGMGTGTGTGTSMDQSGMMRKRDLIRSLHHRRVARWDLD